MSTCELQLGRAIGTMYSARYNVNRADGKVAIDQTINIARDHRIRSEYRISDPAAGARRHRAPAIFFGNRA